MKQLEFLEYCEDYGYNYKEELRKIYILLRASKIKDLSNEEIDELFPSSLKDFVIDFSEEHITGFGYTEIMDFISDSIKSFDDISEREMGEIKNLMNLYDSLYGVTDLNYVMQGAYGNYILCNIINDIDYWSYPEELTKLSDDDIELIIKLN